MGDTSLNEPPPEVRVEYSETDDWDQSRLHKTPASLPYSRNWNPNHSRSQEGVSISGNPGTIWGGFCAFFRMHPALDAIPNTRGDVTYPRFHIRTSLFIEQRISLGVPNYWLSVLRPSSLRKPHMSAGTLSDSPRVRNLLQACRRQIRTRFLLDGLGRFLTVTVFCTVTALVCDWLFNLPSVVRATMLTVCVGASGAAIWKFVIQPMSQSLPDHELGAAIDLSAPELEESLATLISIENPDVTDSEAGSPLMRQHLESQISDRLASVRPDGFVDTRRTVQWCITATTLVLLSLGTAAIFPGSSSVLMSRLLSPFGNHETATNLYFQVPEGDRVVAEGTDVVIAAIPRWRAFTPDERPDDVSLQLISDDNRTETIQMTYDEVSERFEVELSSVTQSLRYRITGGGAVSQTYTMTVQPAPQILAAVMTVTPPDYTGRAVDTFDGMIGEMEVFERSELCIQLDFNKPVKAAALVWKRRNERPADEVELFNLEFNHVTGEAIEIDPEDMDPDAPLTPEVVPLAERVEAKLSSDRRSAVLNLVADVGGDVVLEVIDANGLRNLNEPDRTLIVTYDTPPKLNVQGLHDGDAFEPDGIVAVNSHVADDTGIGSLELHYRFDNEVARILPAQELAAGVKEASHPFRLKLEEFALETGAVVTVRVRATDERPIPRPHEVWSQEFTVRIENDAAAQGSKAMSEESQKMVDSLTRLADELKKDAEKAGELAEEAENKTTQKVRDESRSLSEKEQQQGQGLQRAAEEVGAHPLMKESSQQLEELANQLRNVIPNNLEAASRQADGNSEQLQQAEQKLRDVRQALMEEIENIERQAELEQNLAELGRLAVEADQLAKDAEELENERNDPDRKPADLTEQEWQEQLDQQGQELARHQEALQRDLGDLLQQQEDLRNSARESQQRQMQEIARQAQELADQQQHISEAVDQEAKQAGKEAADLADQLEELQQGVQRLNGNAPEPAQADSADLDRLQNAASDLRKGNLDSPQQDIQTARQGVEQLEQNLEDSQPKQAEQAGRIGEQLQQIEQKIEELQQDRQPVKPLNENDDTKPRPNDDEPKSVVEEIVDRVNNLAEKSRQIADQINQPESEKAGGPEAAEAAEQAELASQHAEGGQFGETAESLNEAAKAAGEAAQNSPQGSRQQDNLNQLQKDLEQVALRADALHGNEQAEAQTRQSTQQSLAGKASQLSQDVADIAERMSLPELQMPQQAKQAQRAAESGSEAAQNSQAAESQLSLAQLQDAGQSGKQAANDLSQLAQHADQAAGQPLESGIPQDIGENVAQALQNLQNAAEALQGQSRQSEPQEGQPGEGQPGEGQPGEGQPGEGQPGEGQPGEGRPSGQLSKAAQALANAARMSLPGEFNPGESSSGQAGEGDGQGNDSIWDGLIPKATVAGPNGSRNWGQLNDQLNSETNDRIGVRRDSEYDALIRMYFREVARAAAAEED